MKTLAITPAQAIVSRPLRASVAPLRRSAITLLAVVAALFLGGCANSVLDAGLDITSVDLLEGAADGVPITVTINYTKGGQLLKTDTSKAPSRVVTLRDEEGHEDAGANLAAVVFENENRVRVTFTINSTATPRPLVITVNESLYDPGRFSPPVLYYGYDSFTFHVHASGALNLAPRLASLSPNTGILNSVVPVTFTGENFDATTQVTVANSTVTASAAYDVTATSFKADLTIPPDARTGGSRCRVVTSSGQSALVDFTIAHDDTRAQIDRIFPNYVEAGSTREVKVSGNNFSALALLESQAPAVLAFGLPSPSAGDIFNLVVDATATAGAVEQDVLVNVRGISGLSLPFPLHVVPAGFAGPRITALQPQPARLTAGSRVQFQIQGANFGDAGVNGFVLLPNARTGTLAPFDVAYFRPTTTAGRNTGVIVDFELLATANLGPASVGIIRADGLTSTLGNVELVAPPAGNAPFVVGAGNLATSIPGRAGIGRGTTQTRFIFGKNLKNVRAVEFRSGGVSVDSLSIEEDGGFGQLIKVLVSAAADAELTGDALTTFRVRTTRGWSNPAAFRVVP